LYSSSKAANTEGELRYGAGAQSTEPSFETNAADLRFPIIA